MRSEDSAQPSGAPQQLSSAGEAPAAGPAVAVAPAAVAQLEPVTPVPVSLVVAHAQSAAFIGPALNAANADDSSDEDLSGDGLLQWNLAGFQMPGAFEAALAAPPPPLDRWAPFAPSLAIGVTPVAQESASAPEQAEQQVSAQKPSQHGWDAYRDRKESPPPPAVD